MIGIYENFELKFSFRKSRKFKDAVHLAYEMEKLKTKPSLLQLTKTLRRKEDTRPTSKFHFFFTPPPEVVVESEFE